ncbi:MAG: hypothetical protein WC359_12590 [Dehalococcoidia bacterium]|jgi:hypothetical protein
MKTCTIKSVYEAIVRMRGIDPLTASYSAAQMAQIAEYINERMIAAWQRTFWPEIMLAEQREYRAAWDVTLNYATGDEVYFETSEGDDKYYVSLQDGNVGQDPETETNWWEEVGEKFLRTIDFQQEGESEIGAVDLGSCVFEKDPRIYRKAGLVTDVALYGDALLVNADEAPARPWIWFRPPVPEYSLTEWDAGTAYAIGDLCYYATSGESYKALQVNSNRNPYTETDYWVKVDFPAFLKTAIKYGAHAEYVLDPVEHAKAEARAENELQSLEERIVDQQGVQRKVIFGR